MYALERDRKAAKKKKEIEKEKLHHSGDSGMSEKQIKRVFPLLPLTTNIINYPCSQASLLLFG